MTSRRSTLQINSLRARLAVQTAELATCTTAAMVLCVQGAIDDTRRQLAELGDIPGYIQTPQQARVAAAVRLPRRKSGRGVNAAAWFYSRSFGGSL